MTEFGGSDVVGRQYIEIWPTNRRYFSELRSQTSQIDAATKRQLEPVAQRVEQHNRRILGGTVAAVARAGKTIVTAGSAAAVAAGAIGLKTAASTEMAEVAFSQLLGGVQQSRKFMGELAVFAARTPFEMPGLIDASRQLIGAGAAAKSVIPTLTAWGNASGSLGVSQENFNGIMLAVTQSMNKGKVQAEELMQITERGIPIYPLLARAMGKSVPELQKLASEGKLLSKDVFPALEKQMNKEYGGGLIKQSQTLMGLWSTFQDTFTQGMAATIQPALPLLKSVLANATMLMQDFFDGIQGRAAKTKSVFSTAGLGIRGFFLALKEGDVTSDGFIGKMEMLGDSVHQFWEGLHGRGEADQFTRWTYTAGLGLRAIKLAFEDGDVTSDGFIGKMEQVGATTRRVFDYVRNDAIPNLRNWIDEFRRGGGQMGKSRDAVVSIGHSLRELAPAIQEARKEMPSLSDALTVSATALSFMADHIDTVTKLMPVIVAGLAAWKLAQIGANIAQTLSIPTKIAEIVVNRQLVKSNRDLIASRQGVTSAIQADTAARSTNILSAALDRFRGAVTLSGSASQNAATRTSFMSRALDRVRGSGDQAVGASTRAASALRGIGTAVSGAVAGLGPLGLALTVATTALAFFGYKKLEAKQRVEEFTRAIEADSGALGTNTRALVAQRLEQDGALQAAQRLGISMQTITDAALGNVSAIETVNAIVHSQTTLTEEQTRAQQYNSVELQKNRQAAGTLTSAIGDTNGELQKAVDSQGRLNSAIGPTTNALRDQGTTSDITASQTRNLTFDLTELVSTEANAERSSLDFKDALGRLTTSVATNGKSMDSNTEKGRANRRAVIDAIEAANRHSEAVFRQTGDINQARSAFEKSLSPIQRQADKIGLNRTEVRKLIDTVGRLPAKRTVQVDVQIRGRVVSVDTGRVNFGGGAGRAGGSTAMAEGGWIPGLSPHDSADDVNVRATGDEFMVRRAAARRLRRRMPGLLEYLNNFHHIDVGGDAANTRVGVDNPLRFATGGSIPNVQSFIRSTDPLPYIWGGGGPRGYDCSGLVGAVYGLLTGRGGGSGQRYFTTDSIGASQGFRPGLGTFSVGVTPGRGHMAGNLAGLGFEARSTASGIIIGGGASSPTSFARKYYLPQLGGTFMGSEPGLNASQVATVMRRTTPVILAQIMRELGVRRDSGGDLLPGQIGMNVSAGRERVLNARQTSDWERAGGNVVHHWHVSGIAPFTQQDVVETLERHAILNGI